MSGITKERWQLRRDRLLKLLPIHNWNISKAGLEAGYTEQYAKTRLSIIIKKDVEFCRKIKAKQAEFNAKIEVTEDELIFDLQGIKKDDNAPIGAKLKAIELLCKIKGMLVERQVIEDTRRQRELTEAQSEEARQLAILRFKVG